MLLADLRRSVEPSRSIGCTVSALRFDEFASLDEILTEAPEPSDVFAAGFIVRDLLLDLSKAGLLPAE